MLSHAVVIYTRYTVPGLDISRVFAVYRYSFLVRPGKGQKLRKFALHSRRNKRTLVTSRLRVNKIKTRALK